MNYYLVVEGESEKKIYKNWISILHPELTYVPAIYDIIENNFSIISGRGYPQYFQVISNAIEDVNNHPNIDRFIISIDSEEMTLVEKTNEVNQFLLNERCRLEIEYIIQHFCFETWALGNKRIGPRDPARSSKVFEYKNYYNVLTDDPELMQGYDLEGFNRSQFAYKYFVELIRLRGSRYSKKHPTAVLNNKFFIGVKKRFINDNQIKSFGKFLNVFL